jgi:hypothetical protein
MTKIHTLIFTALLAGCAAESGTPYSPETFYAAESLADFQSAASEWSQFGFHNDVTDTKPEVVHFSEFRIVDKVCSEWPGSPDNALGCAYALREVGGHLVLDGAMRARAAGDALAYYVEVLRGSDVRRILLHELGHVNGFCHVSTGTVMNAISNSAEHLAPEDLAEPCEY